MARNEEKQLARLNRIYLQKQREEELKKRPPRPKLEMLTTREELSKWLPSITKDIEFYVKQMEVPCYRDQQIEEFNRRIDQLRGEYKAFHRKLRELDPDNKITPWTDRPYIVKKWKVSTSNSADTRDRGGHGDSDNVSSKTESQQLPAKFTPLQTPVLDNDKQNEHNFGYKKPVTADCPRLSDEIMNQPLQFKTELPIAKSKYLNRSLYDITMQKAHLQSIKTVNNAKSSNKQSFNSVSQKTNTNNNVVLEEPSTSLNLPYSDSSSSCDET